MITVDAYFPVRVTTIAERDAQPSVEGLRCFVSDTESEYVNLSGVWTLVIVLRGIAQELALTFPVVLASAGTLAIDIEWTEE